MGKIQGIIGGLDVNEIVPTILSLIAVTAWAVPYIYDQFWKPNLYGRMYSLLATRSDYGNRDSQISVLGLNITATRNDFHIEDVKVRVKYKELTDYIDGDWVWLGKFTTYMEDGEMLKMNILPEETIPFIGTIQKNTTKRVHIIIQTNPSNYTDVTVMRMENLELRFVDIKGTERLVVLTVGNDEKFVHDDRVWRSVQREEVGAQDQEDR